MNINRILSTASSEDCTQQKCGTDIGLQVTQKLEDITNSRIEDNNPCLHDDFIDVIGDNARSADTDHSYLQPIERSPSTESECSGISRSSFASCSISSPDSQGSNRTNYSSNQVRKLTEAFERNKYPDAEEREKIAVSVGVSEKKVKIWFQNKRARSKSRSTTNLRIQPNVFPSLYLPQPSLFQPSHSPYIKAPTMSIPPTSGHLPYSGIPQMTPTLSPLSPTESYGNLIPQQQPVPPYLPSLPYQTRELIQCYMNPYMYPVY